MRKCFLLAVGFVVSALTFSVHGSNSGQNPPSCRAVLIFLSPGPLHSKPDDSLISISITRPRVRGVGHGIFEEQSCANRLGRRCGAGHGLLEWMMLASASQTEKWSERQEKEGEE